MLKEIQAYDVVCDGCGKVSGIVGRGRADVLLGLAELGWVSSGEKDYCPECHAPGGSRRGRVYSLIRMMGAGQTAVVPLRSWNAARSAASTFKRQFGALFKVHREGSLIRITRLK